MRFRLDKRAVCAAATVVLLSAALAGCGGTSKTGSSGTGDGGPPAGGWPQATGGKLNAKMCGLLTAADYKKYGHDLLGLDSATLDKGERRVDCLYQLLDSLTLELQPTAEVAKKLFNGEQVQAQKNVKEDKLTSEYVDGVVPGSDQSWFDVSHESTGNGPGDDKMHEIDVRRGSFLFSITLGGLTAKGEKDPKTELIALAGLVLQRVPDLGKTDTGTAHVLHYVVTGTGKAKLIDYFDPSTNAPVHLANQKLPWHLDMTIPSSGSRPVIVQVSATMQPTGLGLMPPVGCSIAVDSDQLQQESATFAALCTNTYVEVK